MEHKAFKAIVHGVVQGVGFRYYTLRKAQAMSEISGYVKNLPNGTVEVFAEGPESSLMQLMKHIQRGPLGGEVDHIDANWREPTGKFSDFTITY